MSTLVSHKETKLHSEQDLNRYFQDFAKSCDRMRVGIEAEFFAVRCDSGQALPFDGPEGIEAILKALAGRFAYQKIEEGGRVIALQREDCSITLEPGGQIELSAAPVHNVFEIEGQIQRFLSELRKLCEEFSGVAWISVGEHPFSDLHEITWIPKKRYDIMSDYFKTHGPLSHHMMKRTCTNQVNFDYVSEEDAMANLQTVLGLTSIVTALFANSPFTQGKPNGYLSHRMEIWNQTDLDRTGLIVQFTQPGKTFKDYLSYILDMPMLFIVRQNQWIPLKNLCFRRYLKEGFEGQRATLADFELHLSTAFPEARLKQYLEVRGVDAQRPALIPAVAAFWKGILYSCEARQEAWNLVAFAREEDRLKLHHDVPKLGLQAKLGGRPIFPIAKELVDLSCRSLAGQKEPSQSRDECLFLEKIRELIIRPEKSPAQALLEKWDRDLGRTPQALLDYLSIF